MHIFKSFWFLFSIQTLESINFPSTYSFWSIVSEWIFDCVYVCVCKCIFKHSFAKNWKAVILLLPCIEFRSFECEVYGNKLSQKQHKWKLFHPLFPLEHSIERKKIARICLSLSLALFSIKKSYACSDRAIIQLPLCVRFQYSRSFFPSFFASCFFLLFF